MRERPFVADLVSDQTIPKMFKVKQVFPRPKIEPEEIPGIIESLLSQEKFSSKVKPGMRIAITAGSRGIANVALTTKCIADFVRSRGAHPFIVPAMGSHGGATAEGQRAILEGYGITEDLSLIHISGAEPDFWVHPRDLSSSVEIPPFLLPGDGFS